MIHSSTKPKGILPGSLAKICLSIVFVASLAAIAHSCKPAQITQEQRISKLASKYLNDPIAYQFSQDSSYALCTHNRRADKTEAADLPPLLDFIVLNLMTEQLVVQNRVEGQVSWHDSKKIKVVPAKGILDNNGSYLFDVSTQKRLPLNSSDY